MVKKENKNSIDINEAIRALKEAKKNNKRMTPLQVKNLLEKNVESFITNIVPKKDDTED